MPRFDRAFEETSSVGAQRQSGPITRSRARSSRPRGDTALLVTRAALWPVVASCSILSTVTAGPENTASTRRRSHRHPAVESERLRGLRGPGAVLTPCTRPSILTVRRGSWRFQPSQTWLSCPAYPGIRDPMTVGRRGLGQAHANSRITGIDIEAVARLGQRSWTPWRRARLAARSPSSSPRPRKRVARPTSCPT